MAKPTPEKVAELKARAAKIIEEANPEYLVAVDEVGFGPVAGPLTIGAVGVPVNWVPPAGLTDSKELSRKQVAKFATDFFRAARAEDGVFFTLVWSSSEDIDLYGLGRMRRQSMLQGIGEIRAKYPKEARTLAIADGNLSLPGATSIPKADLIVPVVSMAAVIAKHSRDEWMFDAAKEFPGYDWESNVGYDTPSHRLGLERLGPCRLHRMSTATVRKFLH